MVNYNFFFFFWETLDTPELPPIYTKPPDTKKLSLTPPIFHFFSLRTLQGYNGYINIYMPIIPSTPKLRRFGLVQNDVVLGKTCSFANLRIFFFGKKEGIKKKKKKKKRRRRRRRRRRRGNRGVAEPAVWGWPKPPQAFGGGPATPKGQKKKKREKWVLAFGGGRTTPRAWGWLRNTTYRS
jgi:hypothetical protein